ncbi:unnamed protein product [Ilex paraguariensis]|uniref:Uncharacterized protein n=1 Tax=Ilex paraguariensis TaxID=185542 RepID=A0ABC8S7D2_9AQUA
MGSPSRAWVMAVSIGAVEALKDQGFCRWNYSIRSLHQHAKNNLRSFSQTRRPSGSQSSAVVSSKVREEKAEQSEESLRKIMYLSCWAASTPPPPTQPSPSQAPLTSYQPPTASAPPKPNLTNIAAVNAPSQPPQELRLYNGYADLEAGGFNRRNEARELARKIVLAREGGRGRGIRVGSSLGRGRQLSLVRETETTQTSALHPRLTTREAAINSGR